MRILLLAFIFLTSFSFLFSQSFENINANITNLGEGDLAWGDYDNDGDLDVVITGVSVSGTFVTQICRNDSGTFEIIEPGMPGLYASSVEWGDYDMDNDLDLLLSGASSDSAYTNIFKNNDGIFTEVFTGMPGIDHGQVQWVDFDGDGDLDVFLTGSWMSVIYENSGGIFVNTGIEFDAVQNSRSDWGDFDNDGDPDLLLIGDNAGGFITKLYRNLSGVFEEVSPGIEGLFSGTVQWVDFDNDGDLDISLSGFDLYLEPRIFFYTNDGNGIFTEYPSIILGISLSAVEWGDYDSDGDLDIFISGKTAGCGGITTNIWKNTPNGFEEDFTTVFPGFTKVAAGWADFDNDGDLDFLVSGLSPSSVPTTKLYRNNFGTNTFTINTEPSVPQNLQSSVDGDKVLMSWSMSDDNETSQQGLYYNLRIGSYPGGSDILSPLSDPGTGYRMVAGIGNIGQDTLWMIGELDPGTYYWSVQGIDQAYCGSGFGEEQTFEIIATGVQDQIYTGEIVMYPNPVNDYLTIVLPLERSFMEMSVFSVDGQEILSFRVVPGTNRVDLSGLLSGSYILNLQDTDRSAFKLLKR